jgi:hypothetical protein
MALRVNENIGIEALIADGVHLSVSPTSLGFGSTTVGTSTSQVITISNTGNSGVSVSQIAVSGTAYSVTGVALPISLRAGQTMSCTVEFDPLTTGSLPGSVSIVSTATNSPLTITLSSSGVQAASHSVSLSWSDSSTGVPGYNIYRGTMSGGPYAKVNSALVSTAAYTDTAVPTIMLRLPWTPPALRARTRMWLRWSCLDFPATKYLHQVVIITGSARQPYRLNLQATELGRRLECRVPIRGRFEGRRVL